MILHPEKILDDPERETQRNREAWLKDPYFPIRNLRAHGVEPSAGALNTLDGPCLCDFCGASEHPSDGEPLHPAEVMCYGCGCVVCDGCNLPVGVMGRHNPELHRREAQP